MRASSTSILVMAATISSIMVFEVGCVEETAETSESTDNALVPSSTAAVREFADAADAPAYDGDGFSQVQILRVSDGMWLDAVAFEDAIGAARITFFGEQHQTAPVQALERWVLGKLAQRHPSELGLAMEHFQRGQQSVIDRYFAGEIDQATFEAESRPWPEYATYWRPLVEDAKALGRPLFALNVPKEVLNGLYAQFPTWPMDAFDAIPTTSAFDATIPARPLADWDATYQTWFESSFDYSAHGQAWGLSYDDALHYFTDLAQIRDETMALWTARALVTTPRLLVVAGDWHVQTRLALPDRVTRLGTPAAELVTVTTAHASRLTEVRGVTMDDRAVADYILVYR